MFKKERYIRKTLLDNQKNGCPYVPDDADPIKHANDTLDLIWKEIYKRQAERKSGKK